MIFTVTSPDAWILTRSTITGLFFVKTILKVTLVLTESFHPLPLIADALFPSLSSGPVIWSSGMTVGSCSPSLNSQVSVIHKKIQSNVILLQINVKSVTLKQCSTTKQRKTSKSDIISVDISHNLVKKTKTIMFSVIRESPDSWVERFNSLPPPILEC